jgi:hypothetical protein
MVRTVSLAAQSLSLAFVVLPVSAAVSGPLCAAPGEVSSRRSQRRAGVNECKGKGSCAGADNACKAQNACKGQGFTEEKSAKACADKGGKVLASNM